MSIPAIIQFLVMQDNAKTTAQVVEDFESLIIHYNFEYYALFGKTDFSDRLPQQALAGHMPKDWPEIYAEKKYASSDPVLRYLSLTSSGFRWSDALLHFKNDANYRKMVRIMNDGKRHGLVEGYTFPVHGRAGLSGFLCIAGKSRTLSNAEIALFDTVAKQFLLGIQTSMGIPVVGAQTPLREGVTITRRELETLKCIAAGMTSNEISKVMEISSHTVDWYMNGLQEKLNAKNRQHTVAIAFRTGLIS